MASYINMQQSAYKAVARLMPTDVHVPECYITLRMILDIISLKLYHHYCIFPDTTAKPNPGNSIVVKNVAPRQWGGRPYNFGLYKSGTLIIDTIDSIYALMATQCNVGVGSQAVFDYTPQLYFGVVNNMKSGHIFKHISLTQQNFCVDLMKHRNGVVVTLSQNGASGEYVFSASGRTSLNLIMEFFQ